MSVNKVILIGNVGKDPEVRYIPDAAGGPTSTKVASLSIATSERYKDRSGNTVERTEWHNVSVWRGLADVAEKYIRKGAQVYVEGRLRTRSYTDATGVKRYSTEVIADSLQMLGRRSDNPATAQQSQGGYSSPYQTYPTQPQAPAAPVQDAAPAASTGDNGSDDLPF